MYCTRGDPSTEDSRGADVVVLVLDVQPRALLQPSDAARDAAVHHADHVAHRDGAEQRRSNLRAVPYEATSGWSSKASEAELKGVAVCRD